MNIFRLNISIQATWWLHPSKTLENFQSDIAAFVNEDVGTPTKSENGGGLGYHSSFEERLKVLIAYLENLGYSYWLKETKGTVRIGFICDSENFRFVQGGEPYLGDGKPGKIVLEKMREDSREEFLFKNDETGEKEFLGGNCLWGADLVRINQEE